MFTFPTFKIAVLSIVLGMSAISCTNIPNDQGRHTTAARTIEQVLKDHTKELMSLPGVVGTARGLCDQKPCIKVYVLKKTHDLSQKISDIIQGYPVMIEETGRFHALPEN